MSDKNVDTRTWREQGLAATVHRACTKCNAPGVYTSAEHIMVDWPRCWVAPGHDAEGKSVGDRCPQCGASRTPGLIHHLGEIWRRRFT